MTELINQYVERFHENFPLFTVMGQTDEEIEALIRQCLESGTPYTPPDLGEKTLY